MRQDGEIPRPKRDLLAIAEARDRRALRHQVVVHQPLGAGGQNVPDLGNRRHRKTPRRCAFRMEKDRAGHAHRVEGLGKGVHSLRPIDRGNLCRRCKEKERFCKVPGGWRL